MKRIVTIGGGTGTFNLLLGLKKYNFDISAIVSMADSGGSNKIIRDEFGILPTSDVRQCLVALTDEGKNDSQSLMRKLFMYRFNEGVGIKGMTFGNLFMAALTDILGNQMTAIEKTGSILKIKGRVIPVTDSDSNLVAEYENGLKVLGEHNIDEPKHDGKLKIEKIYLEPSSIANPDAVDAIIDADAVIIGPGDLYTSLMVNLVVDGIANAIRDTKAKIIYTTNIMTSFGETYGFTASDHVRIVEKYMLYRKLDYIFLNSAKLPEDIIRKYENENDFPVEDDLSRGDRHVIRADFLSSEEIKKDKSDNLQRSLIRHDGEKIAKEIEKLLN
ncbi:MAG: YvcK family protein [Patescibacteria group bacterium]|nr:YvcK family protein [Patescibacteria group bacterium]